MNDVSRTKIAASRDHRIADWAATELLALLVNRRAAFGVNRAVCACSFVQSAVGSRYHRVGVLLGDVIGNKSQFCFADDSFQTN